MFSSLSKEVSTSKCYLSRGALPQFIDPKQLPSSKRPFSTFLNQHFTHTVTIITCAHSWDQANKLLEVDLILPEELYNLIWEDAQSSLANIRYSRVIMTLSDLLERDFFNVYIKTGTTIMLPTSRVTVFLTTPLDLICRQYINALRRSTWGRRLVYTEGWYAESFLLIIRN